MPPTELQTLQAIEHAAPEYAAQNPALVYLASLAPSGRVTTQSRLETVAALIVGAGDLHALDWARLRYEHIAAIRALLIERGLAPASINATLSALRGVMLAAYNLGHISADDLQRGRGVKNVRGARLPAGRGVSGGELMALLDACRRAQTVAGVRDAALLGVLYCGGLRREEARGLTIGDWNESENALRVLGKGNKERLCYITASAARALCDWLAKRGTFSESAPMFCPVRKNGVVVESALTGVAVFKIIRRRALEAGVLPTSPHDLRRSFVSDLLERDVDIATVQQMAGHSQITTTAQYDRRGERAKRRAADKLHLPYQGD